MAKTYVAGALLPTGGAYMAYRLGCLLSLHCGHELIDLEVQKVDKKLFDYDRLPRTVSVAQFERDVRPDDVLICNPSFSHFLFGSRIACRKLMYVQDFRTFAALDTRFDRYVAVSEVVQQFLHGVYAIEAPVIPACIDFERMPAATPWRERPPHSVLFYLKNASYEHRLLYREWTRQLKERMPHLDVSHALEGRALPQEEFLRRLGSVRYLVNISLAEGFGLVPLEAMAMGAVATGTDGLGGKDYLQQGVNSQTVSLGNLMDFPGKLAELMENETQALELSRRGQETARYYGQTNFEHCWLKELSQFLGKAPHG